MIVMFTQVYDHLFLCIKLLVVVTNVLVVMNSIKLKLPAFRCDITDQELLAQIRDRCFVRSEQFSRIV